MSDDRYVLTGPLDPGTRGDGPLDPGTRGDRGLGDGVPSAPGTDRTSDRRVTVHEVGPRDGLQAEPTALDAQVKIDFDTALLAAGVIAWAAVSE